MLQQKTWSRYTFWCNEKSHVTPGEVGTRENHEMSSGGRVGLKPKRVT